MAKKYFQGINHGEHGGLDMRMNLARMNLAMLAFMICSLMSGAASASVTYETSAGLNLIGVTKPLADQYTTAFPLLNAWKTAHGVMALESYDRTIGVILRTEFDGSGNATGSDFQLSENSALFVYAAGGSAVDLGIVNECSALSLKTGFNLASFFCPTVGLKASDLISSLGISSILSISRLDNTSARWLTSAVNNGTVVGEDFIIVAGEGYIIYSAADVLNWITPAQKFTFSPDILTLHQAETEASLNLTIPYAAPAGGITFDLSSTDTSAVTVPSSISIPQGVTSASVPLTVPYTGNTQNASVEIHAARQNWTGGAAVVTVKPEPTVNLYPTTTLTGQSWTYFLTATLTEAAPAGGLTITLTPSPSGIVSCPAEVIIPEGALSAQVTVTATVVGTATITASAPGKALSGTTNTVTVKAIQTIGIGPMLSPPVGIMVSRPAAATTQQQTYMPVVSTAVGVTVGSVVTGLSPDHGAIGANGLTVRVNGTGLSSATGITFVPATGITIGPSTFTAAADGSYAQAVIDIAQDAPVLPRTVVIGGITAQPATPGADIFQVTYPQPQILAIQPIRSVVGSTFTMTVNGRYLTSASSIDFAPSTGIAVNNPPTVSSDGTTATVTVIIAADAPAGAKVVTVTTPGGTSSSSASAANTFTVTADAGVTYPSLISQSVGVLVTQPAAATTQPATYAPLLSLPVGVAVVSPSIPLITSIAPVSGAIGTTGLTVRVNGTDFSSATGMTFIPATGITVEPSTFIVAADGSYAQAMADIAQDAPLTSRTVILSGVSAQPAVPFANQFRVTLPMPQLLSIQPIRQVVGTTFTLTVSGVNLASASSIDFTPATGISVNNPPTISSDGTTAAVTVSIAANAPTTSRVVTVTAPGGTTSSVASAANAFTVTADAGVTYPSLLSQSVGVLVTQQASSTSQPATYTPVLSQAVGVTVTPAPPAESQSVNYGPVVSRLVGVSVGASVTGITPNTIEPGTTSIITINGTGLSQVNIVQIQPSSGFTVGSVTPAGDGLSVTVSITADAGVTVGTKTLVVSSPSGAIPAASAGANLLLTGPKPVINSIVPILQDAGTTFTIVVHGTHLQGATEVRFVPSDGIHVNNPPTYYTDEQGEHVSVTVTIDSSAVGGQRTVIISTPYGSTDSTPTAANTFTINQPIGWNLPEQVGEKVLLASLEPSRDDLPAVPVFPYRDCVRFEAVVGWAVPTISNKLLGIKQNESTIASAPMRLAMLEDNVVRTTEGDYRFSGYRGPPEA